MLSALFELADDRKTLSGISSVGMVSYLVGDPADGAGDQQGQERYLVGDNTKKGERQASFLPMT